MAGSEGQLYSGPKKVGELHKVITMKRMKEKYKK